VTSTRAAASDDDADVSCPRRPFGSTAAYYLAQAGLTSADREISRFPRDKGVGGDGLTPARSEVLLAMAWSQRERGWLATRARSSAAACAFSLDCRI